MKIKLFTLTIASACSLPFAGFAQGTYLSDPNDLNSHALGVAPGGNVGIGTTAPEAGLDLWTSRGARFRFMEGFGNPTIRFGQTYDDPGIRFYRSTGGSDGSYYPWRLATGVLGLKFQTGQPAQEGAETYTIDAMTILNTGNIGIGTTSPSQKLDVQGNIAIGNSVLGGGRDYGNPISYNNATLQMYSTLSGNTVLNNVQFDVDLKTAGTSRLYVQNAGNVGIGTTTPQAKLDVAGKVNCTVLELTSDRAQKGGFAPVDCGAILSQVARLPLSTWHYTNENSVTHIGPMAQDFQAAFRVGSDDKHIATVDADGVLFAAVQGLHQLVQEKDARIAALETKLAQQERSLATCLAAVEKLTAQNAPSSKTVLAASASAIESSLPSQNLNQENP
jgi:hypothetical protein